MATLSMLAAKEKVNIFVETHEKVGENEPVFPRPSRGRTLKRQTTSANFFFQALSNTT